MSKLVFQLGAGDSTEYPGTCFAPLKSRDALDVMFSNKGIKPDSIYAVAYHLDLGEGFSRLGKKTMINYIHKLITHPSIKPYVPLDSTSKKIWKYGLELPNSISGSSIYIIFSLLRYVVEHPEMVMTAMRYANHVDFDKALYLAHFTSIKSEDFKNEVPDTTVTYQARPTNHSIICTSDPYVGGSGFLSDILPVLTLLGEYKKTYSYGNIQGLMKINNGKKLSIPEEINGAKQIHEVAKAL